MTRPVFFSAFFGCIFHSCEKSLSPRLAFDSRGVRTRVAIPSPHTTVQYQLLGDV